MSGTRAEEQRPWTPERLEILTRLYIEGKSYTEIGLALGGGTTRNACCGKINRLGLSRSPSFNSANKVANGQRNIKIAKVEQMRIWAETAKTPKPPRPKRQPAKVVIAHNAVMEGSTHCAPLPPPVVELTPLVASLVDLQPCHCKWPIGDSDFQFCGRPHVEGRSYCEHHVRRSINAAATRQWDSHGRRRA